MKLRWLILLPCLSVSCTLPQGERPWQVSGPPVAARYAEAPGEALDGLSQAAMCIERGDTLGATEQLRRHLALHPEQIMIRAYLAELLFKLGKWADAQDQFDRFVCDAQLNDGPARQH